MIGEGASKQRTNDRCDTIHRPKKSIVSKDMLGYYRLEEMINWTYTEGVGAVGWNKRR